MKTVFFMPSWYPTKQNPIPGSFFKEQIEVIAQKFDVINFHLTKNKTSLLKFLLHLFIKKGYFYSDKENEIINIHTLIHLVNNNSFFSKKINRVVYNKLLKKIKRFLINNNKKVDILYALTAQINALDASYIAKYLNIPYVVAEHCPFPLPQTSISIETKKAIENADCVISISRDKTRQMLMQGLQFEPALIGNMVDEEKFVISNKYKNKIFTILIVAANNFYKDYPTFFKTMRCLKKCCNIPFKILIVGYNPVEKSIWNNGEQQFKNMLTDYGIQDICELIPKATREEMPVYYHKANVFVMTSIQEGFPVSSLEATACGIPVYATRCGGVEDFIDDENGKIVNIQDFEKLALELKELLEGKVSYNPELIRQKTINNYGKQAFLTKMTHVFNRVIAEYAEKKTQ